MKFKAEIRGFILFLFYAHLTSAQIPDRSFNLEPITIDDGLSQGYISSILQDRKGFMWFGTLGGLNRYDGHNFKVFQFVPFDTVSLSGNNISSLYEDHKGRIWIGTWGQGLNVYDPQLETVFRLGGTVSRLLDGIGIFSICEDHIGNIWVGGDPGNGTHGLYRITPDTLGRPGNKYNSYSIKAFQIEDPGTLANLVYVVHAHDRELWIGSGLGMYSIDPANDTPEFKSFFEPLYGDETAYSGVFSFLSDGDTLWIGRSGSIQGLNTKTRTLFGGPPPSRDKPWVFHMQMDRHDKIWFTDHWGRGVGNIHKDSIQQGISAETTVLEDIKSLYIDRSDVVWLGMKSRGIYKYSPGANRFNPLKNVFGKQKKRYVASLFEDKLGQLWINNDILDRHEDKLSRPSYIRRNFSRLTFMNTDSHGDLWALIEAGKLWSYDPLMQKERIYTLDTNVSIDGPLYIDQRDILWWGVAGYLFRFDPGLEEFRSYKLQKGTSNNKVGNYYSAFFRDHEGILWIGSQQGLLSFEEEKATFRVFRHQPSTAGSISSDRVLCIEKDPNEPDDYFWLGTEGGGLNRMHRKTGTFTNFTTRDGLSDNTVYGVLSDSDGNLWMSSNKGISKLDVTRTQFRNYDADDGLQSNEFNRLAYFKASNGEMFFGGIAGFNAFYPSKIKDNPHPPSVVITNLRIGNQTVSHFDTLSPLQKAIGETKELILEYDQNLIGLEYAALDFNNPRKNQYAYKLEGLYEEWIPAGNNRLATFTNLDPGNYTFRVKGSNNDGVWNEEGVSIDIVIKPPWWLSWWAYASYALMVLAIAALIMHLRIRRIRLKSKLAFEQSEANRAKELEEMKSRFFSNIAHEFRTPLTLILGPVENMLEDEKNDRRRLSLLRIKDSGKRLLRLINQLLDLSKLENQKMKVEWTRGNLNGFIERVVDPFFPMAQSRGIELQFREATDLKDFDFDAGKLEKIAQNLISNALKFTRDKGTVIVSLSGLQRVNEKPYVELSVHDNGLGIDEQHLPHIFNRFYRVENEAGYREGTGIGLALCKELALTFGGEITVESSRGHGSRFAILIPFVQNSDTIRSYSKKELPLTEVPTPVQSVSDPKIIKVEDKAHDLILLVEDNDELRSFIRDCLSDHYRIAEAKDGLDGMKSAFEEVPDLIISDVMMPEMDGLEFTRNIKSDERTSHIPVIMLTARTRLENRLKGLEEGVEAYVNKPFNRDELLLRVRKLLEGRKLLQRKYQQQMSIGGSSVPGHSKREHTYLQKAREIVERHMDDPQFDVDTFCGEIGMSRTQLHRKLKALTGYSTTAYVRSVRLKKAMEMLQSGLGNVTEVAYAVGFSSQTYFSRCFFNQFGITPSHFLSSQEPENP